MLNYCVTPSWQVLCNKIIDFIQTLFCLVWQYGRVGVKLFIQVKTFSASTWAHNEKKNLVERNMTRNILFTLLLLIKLITIRWTKVCQCQSVLCIFRILISRHKSCLKSLNLVYKKISFNLSNQTLFNTFFSSRSRLMQLIK